MTYCSYFKQLYSNFVNQFNLVKLIKTHAKIFNHQNNIKINVQYNFNISTVKYLAKYKFYNSVPDIKNRFRLTKKKHINSTRATVYRKQIYVYIDRN